MRIKKIELSDISNKSYLVVCCRNESGDRTLGLGYYEKAIEVDLDLITDKWLAEHDDFWYFTEGFFNYRSGFIDDMEINLTPIHKEGSYREGALNFDIYGITYRLKNELQDDISREKIVSQLSNWQNKVNELLLREYPCAEIWLVDNNKVEFLFAGGEPSGELTKVIKRKISL